MITLSQKLRDEFEAIDTESRANDEKRFADWLQGRDESNTPYVGTTMLYVDAPRGTFSRECRDLGVATAGAGANTVGEGLIGVLARRLQSRNPFWRWARIIESNDGIGSVTLPTCDDTANTAGLKAENTTREVAADLTIAQKTFTTFKCDSGLLKVSNELLTDSQLFNSTVGEMLAARLDKKVGELLTIGNGTTEPEGVVVGAGDSGVSGLTVSPSLDALLDLKYSLDVEWHESPSFVFLMHPTIWKNAKKAFGAEAAAFFRPKSAPGEFDTLDGSPVIPCKFMSTTLTERGVVCGDLSQFAVVVRRNVFVSRVAERFAELYQSAFSQTLRLDANVLSAHAVKFATL